jgi:hypothetical protein
MGPREAVNASVKVGSRDRPLGSMPVGKVTMPMPPGASNVVKVPAFRGEGPGFGRSARARGCCCPLDCKHLK